MPLHLPSLSRRRFLAGSLAAGLGAALPLGQLFAADDGARAGHWTLVSDAHINADPATVARGKNMTENFRRVAGEITERSEQPAGVILSGDCAHLYGRPGDYEQLAKLLDPFSKADCPVHMMMGNHDERENFRRGFARQLPEQPLVEGRLVSVIETSHANWFLLDSLDQLNKTPGMLGPAQRRWLAEALDARPNKPALIVGHHNPRFGNPAQNNTGLLDTDELFAVLSPRRQVKAYIFGHTHFWGLARQDGIHLVNLPPTAYLFAPGGPIGWVDVWLTEGGARLEMHAINRRNSAAAERVELEWRAG
jgi:predicted phosphodiesterase